MADEESQSSQCQSKSFKPKRSAAGKKPSENRKKSFKRWKKARKVVESLMEGTDDDESISMYHNQDISPLLEMKKNEDPESLSGENSILSDDDMTESESDNFVASDTSEYEDSDKNSHTTDSDDELGCKSAHDFDCSTSSLDRGTDGEEFVKELRNWAIKNSATRQSVNDLLAILRANGHQELPKDARTLLKTESHVACQKKCDGLYLHFGLKNGIIETVRKIKFNAEIISLDFNVDGIPLYKSSNTQLWPILAKFGDSKPFIVSLFCGSKKPSNCSDFLAEFLSELTSITTNGIDIDDIHFECCIHSFICDAPARAFLKGITGHNGYYCCERCVVKGSYKGKRMILPKYVELPRTNYLFRENYYSGRQNHQRELSPLLIVQMDLIQGFVLDYMHLVCLGVVRRMLYFWKGQINGTSSGKLSSTSMDTISAKLKKLNGLLPSEFARQPRSLDILNRWKATELRSFLLYTGIVVLRGVLSEETYKHFLSLSVAIRILCTSERALRESYIDDAQLLIEYFVGNSNEHYGELFCVYNVHSLLHICEDVRNLDLPLDDISAFPFENYLGSLKNLVRSKHNPVVQIAKRVKELGQIDVSPVKTQSKVGIGAKNSHFLVANGLVIIKDIRFDGLLSCIFYSDTQTTNFFENFVESKKIGIFFVKNDIVPSQMILERKQLLRKCVGLPYENGKVFIVLLHSDN